ncbi:hypothetical protein [Sphingobium sp. KCTC 72723]|uniref:hypothetical protein n=1 Tax=Sphingobium sp. KCTC 72723 TaxID=2733867 RepID=UPI001CB7219C|nr:hypothetical protein [Sphingobium sp. KCTC 72723]
MILKRVFGRRTTPPVQQNVVSGLPTQPDCYGGDVELDMKQVAAYANAMARHRGYPEDTAAMIARRVVFLERRNLAGLANLHREVDLFHNEPLTSRFNLRRPDGSEGRHCPFYAGIDLESSFDRLTSVTPGDRVWTPAPSNALLLVPKLAEWLRPTGRRAIFWWGKEKEVPGFIVVEGFRLDCYAKAERWEAFDKLQRADHIGFSDCPDDFEPAPQPRSGFCEKVTLQLRHVAMMEDYLRS